MLRTELKHLETTEEFHVALKDKKNLMVCCGRMGPMCVPVYREMERLEEDYPHVAFCDMDFDIEAASVIRELPECKSFMGLPFVVYFRDGEVTQASAGIQSRDNIVLALNEQFKA
jgi:thioredoxin 1